MCADHHAIGRAFASQNSRGSLRSLVDGTDGEATLHLLYYKEMQLLRLLIAPERVLALEDRFVVVTTGIRISLNQATSNIIAFLATSAVGVCTLIFLIGAAVLTFSGGDQTKKDNAKNIMKFSLIGLAIILASYGIVRTVLYYLYEAA